jgi:hypothetical protein
MAASTDEFKVKLVSALDVNSSEATGRKVVIFNVSPQINEQGTVEYDPIQIIQGPTTFQAYKGTSARTFSLSTTKLISRTPTEARDNIQILNILRSWRMPYFGYQKNTDDVSKFFSAVKNTGALKTNSLDQLKQQSNALVSRLGAPPEILYFSAYSQSNSSSTSAEGQFRGNIKRVPVVLTSLSITYPDDVAYIPTAMRGEVDALGGVPFPVIMTIGLELTETHSPGEVNVFNLAKYANGVLDGF